ncbi:MAG: hypothetical protein ACRC7O_18340 [Fimbriiglobus sp.]
MKYTVDWEPSAEQDLARVWVAAEDQDAVTRATDLLDSNLAREPLAVGEARISSVVRVAFEPPLGVEFEVIADDRRVRVLRVWAAG